MQKFTRSLTREIEIEGERLAITIGPEGVSARIVGSRRPPCTLDWPGILCALTDPGRSGTEELARALATIRQGAAASPETAPTSPGLTTPEASIEALSAPAAPPPSSQVAPASRLSADTSSDLSSLLQRLDVWLSRHRPRYHLALLPGVCDAELDSLAQTIGRPVPEDLKTWLRWHNGQQEDLIGAFHETFNLMSAAQIAAAWQDRQARGEPTWNPAWIPFLDDYQDDLLVLDSSELGAPIREVWRGQQDHAILAPTLAAWLTPIVRDIEAGKYLEDPERGEFRRV